MPLFAASDIAAWPWAGLFWLLHALPGAGLVHAVRPVLWSKQWADMERALPLNRHELLRADAIVAALTLAPLWTLYGLGTWVWIDQASRANAGWATGLLGLSVSAVTSTVGGTWILGRERHQASRWSGRDVFACLASAPAAPAIHWPIRSAVWALWWNPLWWGAARRVGKALVGITALQLLVWAATWVWPSSARWCWLLAGPLHLWLSQRVRSLVITDLAPLHMQAAHLPLNTRHWDLGRWAIALWPSVTGLAWSLGLLLGTPMSPALGLVTAYIMAWMLLQA